MNHSANGVIAVGAPGSQARKETNQKAFSDIYREELERAMTEYPEEYIPMDVNVLHGMSRVLQNRHRRCSSTRLKTSSRARMMAALLRGSANKDSCAIKATCERLGLKHTYQAINGFLNGD
jgi:hypothetical protein